MVTNRNEGGRFTPEHTDEEILAAVRAHEPAATSEVAEELGVSRQGADYRLRQLHDEGRVSNKKIGASLVWFDPTEAVPEVQPDTATGAQDTTKVAGSPPSSAQETSPSTGDNSRLSSGPEADTLADVAFPEGRDREVCEAAVLAARDYLREQGPATMRELVTKVMPTHPVGYDVPELEPGDRYRGAWWRRVVKPGLKALPDVQPPSRGASDWRSIPESEREPDSNG